MAHKGKLWPVLFRRDWNLNVLTNDEGWANRYHVVLANNASGFGSLATRGTYDCGPAIEMPFGTMRWKSVPFLVGPFAFHVELTSDFGPTGSWYNKTGQLFEDHVGLISIWREDNLQSSDPGFGSGEHGSTIFWDTTFWISDPALWLSSIRPKVWSEGPPH